MGIPFSFNYATQGSLEIEIKPYIDLTPVGNITLGVSFIRRQVESGVSGKLGPWGGESNKIKEKVNYINTEDGVGSENDKEFKSDERVSYGPVSTGNTDKVSFGIDGNLFIAGTGAEIGVEKANSNSNSNAPTNTTPISNTGKKSVQKSVEKKAPATPAKTAYKVTLTD